MRYEESGGVSNIEKKLSALGSGHCNWPSAKRASEEEWAMGGGESRDTALSCLRIRGPRLKRPLGSVWTRRARIPGACALGGSSARRLGSLAAWRPVSPSAHRPCHRPSGSSPVRRGASRRGIGPQNPAGGGFVCTRQREINNLPHVDSAERMLLPKKTDLRRGRYTHDQAH